MTRSLRKRLAREQGLTLIELLVGMTLMLTVGGLATAALLNAGRNTATTQERSAQQASNRVAVERVMRLLRQATFPQYGTRSNSTVITVAEPQRVVFTSRLAGGPVRGYASALNGTTLGYGVSDGVCPTPAPAPGTGAPCTYAEPAPTTPLVENVLNENGGGPCTAQGAPADGHVFSYLARDATTGQLVVLPQPIVSSQLGQIVAVRIDVYSRSSLARDIQGCEPLSAQVQLRNQRL